MRSRYRTRRASPPRRCFRARCRARWIRRPVAASTRAARSRSPSAGPSSPGLKRSRRATRSPATFVNPLTECPAMPTTLIKNAEWLVAWNGAEHVYLRNADIAFRDDRSVFVGQNYDGPSDTVIDVANRMIMPGLVNVHSHPSHEPAYRGIREEHGVSNMYMSGLYERSGAFDTSSRQLRQSSLEVALCELLKSGVTSLCDISPIFDGWADIFRKAGMRGFLAPGFASARWKLENDPDQKSGVYGKRVKEPV